MLGLRPTSGILKTRPRCLKCHSLPSIRDFIKQECPVKGWDGVYREQLQWQQDCTALPAIGVAASDLVVPGQRRLFDVSEVQLDHIIAEQGKVVISCFETGDGGSKKLAAPRKGSWSCVGGVAGLQRRPGSSRALVRVLVADRVAVQALDCSLPGVTRCQASPLSDRWTYFVRSAALEQHTGGSSSGTGSDVLTAVQQVQDACGELLQLLLSMEDSVATVMDASTQQTELLSQLLAQHEAGDELSDIVSWCQLASPMDLQQQAAADGGGSQAQPHAAGPAAALPDMPADARLMERAWRLSFAPFAAKGLAAALAAAAPAGSSAAGPSAVQEALETMDLGMRLEAALELAQHLRTSLAAQLALSQLQQ